MNADDPITSYRELTRTLALALDRRAVYKWLVQFGYYPESYVVPPCFRVVTKSPSKRLFPIPKDGRSRYAVPTSAPAAIQFPRSVLTDRTFGVIDPRIHNDIAFDISCSWQEVVRALIPEESVVTSYTFPVPIDSASPGRMGKLRSGRSIYEFLLMTEDHLAAVAYKFTHIVHVDISNFYPSIYTHGIAWAMHGKEYIRQPKNRRDYRFLGNRLDKLFCNANDECTNGLPIGPVVCDIAAEIMCSAVDVVFSNLIRDRNIRCAAVRFKDDYRILTGSEADAKIVVKCLQTALKEYNLEVNEGKTNVYKLPDGLFRKWSSRYHAIFPRKRSRFTWKEFRELYLGVVEIDRQLPGTGVVDRFLADIVTRDGILKIRIQPQSLERVISMLLMLGSLRTKALPKVLAILESILRSPFGIFHKQAIVRHLDDFLAALSDDEVRNRYAITWIGYFLISNELTANVNYQPALDDPFVLSVWNNQGLIFADRGEFTLFEDCISVGKRMTMFEYLRVFEPPVQ